MFVSLCQGGLTIIISAFVFIWLYNVKRPKRGRAWILMIVAFLTIAFYWVSWDTVVAGFNYGVSPSAKLSAGRLGLWEDSL